jgi:hypothetical protein
MLDGLTEEEADTIVQENPTLVSFYEIDVVKEAGPYQISDEAAIFVELGRTREALERRYRLNPNYAVRVKEEIDKLLRVGFIRPVKWATWLSPIVVVPKKNGKLWVCVDYRKLNAATITDAFPLPFTDGVLNTVAGHEMYKVLDGFSSYNQIRMAEEDPNGVSSWQSS